MKIAGPLNPTTICSVAGGRQMWRERWRRERERDEGEGRSGGITMTGNNAKLKDQGEFV